MGHPRTFIPSGRIGSPCSPPSWTVRGGAAAEGAFGQAFNHIQDIYADDLAFLVFATDEDDRAYEFFSAWIEGNTTMRGRNRWKNVGLAATNGFALGNLVRHGRLSKDDPLW